MYRNSLPWPHVNNQAVNGKEDDKDSVSVSGEWVDKIRMNRTDSLTSDDSLVEQWETDSPSSFSENSKLCLEPAFDIATMTTEESDELEIATSDSSESDMNWLIQAPKPTAVSNGLASNKAKKSINPRPSKIPEVR